jgi:hypothetical protein
MNTDYQDIHAKNVHNGKKIKFSPVVEPSQIQLHTFFTRPCTSANTGQCSVTVASCSTPGSDISENTVEDDLIRFSKDCTPFPEKAIEIQSHLSVNDEPSPGTELRDEFGISNANIDQVPDVQPDVLVTATDDVIDELRIIDQEMLCIPPAGTGMVSGNPVTDNSKFESDITERPPVFNKDTSSTATSAATSRAKPANSINISNENVWN